MSGAGLPKKVGGPGEASSPALLPWRRSARRTLLHDRWIHLHADAYVTATGAMLDPWYMLQPPDFVHVLAITPDDRLVLVRQWRPGAGAAVLELPGGLMEPHEADPAAAGRRECLEETGHAAPAYRTYLSLFPDPAHASNRIHFVLAERAELVAPQRLDHGEDIVVELHPVAEVLAGLPHGMLLGASQVGAVLLGLREAGRIAW